MKLKCDDGKVRDFSVSHCDGDFLSDGTRQEGSQKAMCNECGEEFGVHDTYILKPIFRAHICKQEKTDDSI